MGKKLYIAVGWDALAHGNQVARVMEAYGYTITSHFLQPGFVPEGQGEDREISLLDMADIQESDAMLVITGRADQGLASTTGGRHVEFGVALGSRMPVCILGPRENVFHHLPEVLQADTPHAAAIAIHAKIEAHGPQPKLWEFLDMVEERFVEAARNHPIYASAHEGLAVMLEEFEELKAHVWRRREERDHQAMLEECTDLAAACSRFAVDLVLNAQEAS